MTKAAEPRFRLGRISLKISYPLRPLMHLTLCHPEPEAKGLSREGAKRLRREQSAFKSDRFLDHYPGRRAGIQKLHHRRFRDSWAPG